LEGEFRSEFDELFGSYDIVFPDKGKLTWKDGGVYVGDVSGAYRTGR
jgi:hypothetical protein